MKHFNYNRLGDENQPVFGRDRAANPWGARGVSPRFFPHLPPGG